MLRAESRALASYVAANSAAQATLVVSDEIYRPGQDVTSDSDREQYISHWKALHPSGLHVITVAGGHHDLISSADAILAVADAIRSATPENRSKKG